MASNSGANSNYYNENRIVLYGSYKSNFGNGNYGSSILFQSQIQEQHGKQILILSFWVSDGSFIGWCGI